LIADAHAHRRSDEAAVSIRPKRSCDRQRALSLSAAQERAPVCCLLFRKDARSGAGTGLANAPRSLVLPEIAEPLGRKFAIPNRMLDVLVAEIVLQQPRIHTLIGQLEPS
jgi:hypothetical protein